MSRLMEDLLKLAKIGRQERVRVTTDLNSLLKNVLGDLQPDFEGRQIDWHIGDYLLSDIRQFTSVLCSHLLSHQRKFSLIRSTLTEMRGMGFTVGNWRREWDSNPRYPFE
jgi:light-regulated signal transduction histidine kinase (bacteriophytochrome)